MIIKVKHSSIESFKIHYFFCRDISRKRFLMSNLHKNTNPSTLANFVTAIKQYKYNVMVWKLKLSDKHAPSFSENFTVGAAMLGIPSSVNISYPLQLDIIVNYIKNEFAMTLVHVAENTMSPPIVNCLSRLELSVESNPWFVWFCQTSLCDWCRKLTPPSQPIRNQTKASHDLNTRVFPRFTQVAFFYFEF